MASSNPLTAIIERLKAKVKPPKSKWKKLKCDNCDGHGQRSTYTIDGGDFQGADECKTCGGSGTIWRSPQGSLAQYPGGPFVGKESKPTPKLVAPCAGRTPRTRH